MQKCCWCWPPFEKPLSKNNSFPTPWSLASSHSHSQTCNWEGNKNHPTREGDLLAHCTEVLHVWELSLGYFLERGTACPVSATLCHPTSPPCISSGLASAGRDQKAMLFLLPRLQGLGSISSESAVYLLIAFIAEATKDKWWAMLSLPDLAKYNLSSSNLGSSLRLNRVQPFGRRMFLRMFLKAVLQHLLPL